MATHSINIHSPSLRCTKLGRATGFPPTPPCFTSFEDQRCKGPPTVGRPLVVSRRRIRTEAFVCSAIQQESSAASTVAEVKEEKPEAPKEAPQKPKRAPPAKTPTKPLPELMAEEVIPPLRAILQAEKELSDLELLFHDNQLEGSFVKNGVPYTFWAFFPSGGLIGPKGFSLSSYGSGPSTVEPFLVDEKKITAKHVIFWVEKRLAAQGILPVWKE
ncbi:uncharacterized protein LOC116249803 [Nymphaea colorata]|nr:uncharacterized protein LOC116249803 [Nymphaea colorata]